MRQRPLGLKLAREIAARTEPRFIEIEPEPRRKPRVSTRFMEIPRQRGGGRVSFTEAELTAMRGGLTAEEYRLKFVRKWGGPKKRHRQREQSANPL